MQILVGGTVVGATYALIAVGFSLVYQVTGVINLSQGAFCVLSALLAWSFKTSFGPTWAAVPLAIVATTLLGTAVGALTFAPGLARLSNANMLMLTAGLLTLAEGLFMLVWGSQPYALPPFSTARPILLHGLLIPTQALWILSATVVVIAALWYGLSRTLIGQALRACAEDATAARLMGIDVRRMSILSFGLASAIGAIAGVVLAPTTSLQFDSGRLLTVYGFVAVAVGGIGSFPGAVAGGMLLGLLQQLTTAYVSSLFSSAIALVFLLAMLVFKPAGLVALGAPRRLDVGAVVRTAVRGAPSASRRTAMAGVLVVLFFLALPAFVTAPAILSGFVIAGIFFLALIGLDVVMGYAGQVNLGQAGFLAVGGYLAAYLATRYDGLAPLIATAAGIAAAIVVSFALSLVTMKLRGLYLALATLSFGLLIDAFAVGLVDYTGGPSGLVGIPSFAVGAYEFDTPTRMYYLVAAIDVCVVVLLRGAMRTDFGRALKAVRGDQMAAEALGVNVRLLKVLTLAISAALAAAAGALYAFFFRFLSPEMVGTQQSFLLVAMLVLGGEGSLVGSLTGSLLLTMLPVIFQPLALYKTFATGLLLVLCFLFLPQGILGLLIRMIPSDGHRPSYADRRTSTGRAER